MYDIHFRLRLTLQTWTSYIYSTPELSKNFAMVLKRSLHHQVGYGKLVRQKQLRNLRLVITSG